MYTSLKYLVIFEDDLFDLLFIHSNRGAPISQISQLSTVCNFGCSTMYQCNCSGYSRGGTLTIQAIGLEGLPFGTCTIFTMHCIIHIFHHNHQNCHYLYNHHQRHYYQHKQSPTYSSGPICYICRLSQGSRSEGCGELNLRSLKNVWTFMFVSLSFITPEEGQLSKSV